MSDDAFKETAVQYTVEEYQSPFAPLIDELYREEVLEARRMPMEEKFILGERLFRWACAVTLEGIRFQNPAASEDECQHMLRERIKLGEKLKESNDH
ncbi:MAG: hypothetical protein ABI042_18230 [Verrucomicrobiota bacterium]